MEKSIYELSEQELAEMSPGDFNTAYILAQAPLVEEWSKTTWFKDEGWGKIPGRTQLERDLNTARYARILQNYVDAVYPANGRDGHVKHFKITEALKIAENNIKNFGDPLQEARSAPANLTEAPSAAQTSAWSGATTLPLILGYARKIMPKLYAMQFYQVQPIDRPTGRVFFIVRNRDNNGTTDGQVEQLAGWSYRSWITDPGENTAITKAVTFTITSSDVTAKSRKIQAQTTLEVEQDLRAYFGLDAVGLVSDIATDEMAIEIDAELVYALYNHATVNGVGKFQYGTANVPSGQTQESYDKRILEVMNAASLAMWHQKRVLPNYAIFGSDWALKLSNVALWRTNTEEFTTQSFLLPGARLPINGAPEGLAAALPFPTTDMILGHKGSDYVDGSAFFLPYLPLQLTGVLFDPNTMHRTLSWISRYTSYFHKFSGQNESFSWATINSSLSDRSYAANIEYI